MSTVAMPEGAPPLLVEASTFRAMGTDAHVIVVGAPRELLDVAQARLDELERRWSRFLPESELCRLNANPGVPVVVAPVTFELIARACNAWVWTNGAFDPTVLAAVEAAGYDRDFAAVPRVGPAVAVPTPEVPGCALIELDPLVGSVVLPVGLRLDFGGIGKGFAADLVVDELMAAGAGGVCINVGGDLRVEGRPPEGDAWVIEIESGSRGGADERRPRSMLSLAAGAVATTSRERRVWHRGGRVLHHVIDPATGAPARSQWMSATVVSGRAVDAEPLAKALLLASTSSDAAARLREHNASGCLVDQHGRVHQVADLGAFLVREEVPSQ